MYQGKKFHGDIKFPTEFQSGKCTKTNLHAYLNSQILYDYKLIVLYHIKQGWGQVGGEGMVWDEGEREGRYANVHATAVLFYVVVPRDCTLDATNVFTQQPGWLHYMPAALC